MAKTGLKRAAPKKRPRKAKAVRKLSRKMPHKGRKVAKPAKPKHDPLDDLIAAGARALDLKIDKAWVYEPW